ncbi:MAG: hypothetical protein AAGD09_06910 [Cyanobacteria bacterium P01_F01_bin.56]
MVQTGKTDDTTLLAIWTGFIKRQIAIALLDWGNHRTDAKAPTFINLGNVECDFLRI